MTIKEILIQEIESSPDFLLEETLDFLRFLKTKQATVNKDTQFPQIQPQTASSDTLLPTEENPTDSSELSQEDLNYDFEKICQQIESLKGYVTESPMQQTQAMAALEILSASIKNLKFFTKKMQASLEVMQDIHEELLQQNGNMIAEYQVYHDLFKFAPDAYFVTTGEGIILEVNYMAGALLNVLPSLLIGKSLTNFVSLEDRSLFLANLKHSLDTKSVREMEVSICPRDRQTFTALVLVKAGRESSGTLGALQICLHDITKYKQIPQLLPLAATQQPLHRLDGLRVLFVDDEADTRELITTILMQHGVEVTTVATVAEALEEVERSRPDVIISDIRMPNEDGYALIRKIKAIEAEKGWQIPTAALTAYLTEDRAKAISAGFQSHLHKLAAPAELIAMIAQMAGRG